MFTDTAHLYLPVPNTLMILQGKNLIPISKQGITLTVIGLVEKANELFGNTEQFKLFFVPRADIAVSVAIVYSWWLLKDLSIKWLL